MTMLTHHRLTSISVAVAACLLLCCCPDGIVAYPSFRNLIPNGHRVMYNGVLWAPVGHVNWIGGPQLNPFGRDFRNMSFSWSTALCQADSDEDGFTNGQELGDPNCEFQVGGGADDALVGDAWTMVSHPGFNDSTPVASASAVTSAFQPFITGANFTEAFEASSPSFLRWMTQAGAEACQDVSARFGRFACNLRYDFPGEVLPTTAAGTTTTGASSTTTAMTTATTATTVTPTATTNASVLPSNMTTAPMMPSGRPTLQGATLVMRDWVQGLEDVDLSNQQLTGILNLSAIAELPIRRIVLRNNSLTGTFNARLLPATLEELDLSHNALSGSFNLSGVTMPPNLVRLALHDNAFVDYTISGMVGANPNLVVDVASRSGTAPPGGASANPVIYTCGAPHAAFTFVDASGAVVTVLQNAIPASCTACFSGAQYDISQDPCVLIPGSMLPWATATVTVRLRDDIANYCDSGCTAVLVLLLLFLVAIVVFIAVFKLVIVPHDAPRVIVPVAAPRQPASDPYNDRGNRVPPTADGVDATHTNKPRRDDDDAEQQHPPQGTSSSQAADPNHRDDGDGAAHRRQHEEVYEERRVERVEDTTTTRQQQQEPQQTRETRADDDDAADVEPVRDGGPRRTPTTPPMEYDDRGDRAATSSYGPPRGPPPGPPPPPPPQ